MRCLALLVLLAPAACTGPASERRSNRQRPAGVVDEEAEPVCKDEAPTGTILTRPVCRTRYQSEEDRRRAMELLSSPKRIGR